MDDASYAEPCPAIRGSVATALIQLCHISPIVAIICQALLRPDRQYAAVQQEHAAVVAHGVVHERHADVAHDVARQLPLQQLLQGMTPPGA